MQTRLDDTLNDTLIALADPTRRAILAHLLEGEARVTDLAAPFAISLNAVSKHIRMLERADLVRRRRVGREQILAFNPAPLEEASDWIEGQRAAWGQRFEQLQALLGDEAFAKAAGAKTAGAKTAGAKTAGAQTAGAQATGAKAAGANLVGAKRVGTKMGGANDVGAKHAKPRKARAGVQD